MPKKCQEEDKFFVSILKLVLSKDAKGEIVIPLVVGGVAYLWQQNMQLKEQKKIRVKIDK